MKRSNRFNGIWNVHIFLLPVPQTTTVSAPSQEREDYGSSLYDDEEEDEVNLNRLATAAEKEVIHSPKIINDETLTDPKEPSTFLEEYAVDEKVRRIKEAMDVDSSEFSRGYKNPGNQLETFLG